MRQNNIGSQLYEGVSRASITALAVMSFIMVSSAQAGTISFEPFSVNHGSEWINSPPDDGADVRDTNIRQLEINARVIDDDTGQILTDEVIVTAVNSAQPGQTFTLRPFGGPVFTPAHFLETAFDQNLADGSWTLTATRISDGTATTATVGPHNPLTVLDPFDLSTVTVSGDLLTPTLSWDTPTFTSTNGGGIDALLVQVADPDILWAEENSVFFQQALDLGVTSFTLPDNVLDFGDDYILRVRASYFDESNNFQNLLTGFNAVTAGVEYSTVPEPGTLALLALGLVHLGVSRRRRR